MELIEQKLKTLTSYHGVIVNVRLDEARLPDGSTAKREVVEHPGGMTVLPLEPDGTVWCVRQYRYPYGEALLELPAGKLEYGEDPLAAGKRELKEETGAVPDTFLPMGVTLPSPGCLSERLYLFLAKGLHMESQQLDEDEFLNVERIPFNEMVHRVMDGEIEDSKTIAAVLKAKVLLNL